jgi:hypothetical protein
MTHETLLLRTVTSIFTKKIPGLRGDHFIVNPIMLYRAIFYAIFKNKRRCSTMSICVNWLCTVCVAPTCIVLQKAFI